jgi:uncharacterized protein (UPF0264 family)
LQLLVSVRSADEVAAAIAGGAEIIDAKEPSRGSLGPVDLQTLSGILECIPETVPVSVALGDFCRIQDLEIALHGLEVPVRPSPMYLKLGFAGLKSVEQVALLLATAVSAAREKPVPWRIVPVAYADSERARSVPPMLIPQLAAAAGASGVLVDTWGKDGRGLLSWLSPDMLARWVAGARQAGLLTALAGSLSPDDVMQACSAGPDVIGTRGAVCTGGREGRVSEDRVQWFRRALSIGSSRDPAETASTLFAKRVTPGALSVLGS